MEAGRAREILRKNRYCIIATASTQGLPWLSPVFFNYDSACRILWESARDSRHSRLIEDNSAVALVISDLDGGGASEAIYREAEAREVPAESLEASLEAYQHGPHQKKDESADCAAADYEDDSPLRLYEAIPTKAYTITQTTTPEGFTIDERVEIELSVLCAPQP